MIGESVKQRLLQSVQFMVFHLFVCVNADFLKGIGMVFVTISLGYKHFKIVTLLGVILINICWLDPFPVTLLKTNPDSCFLLLGVRPSAVLLYLL